MYYVLRHHDNIMNYHARFEKLEHAKEYAEGLKKDFGHQYVVLKVETVWTTQTLTEAMEEF
jgi:hypothetical protein